MVFNDIVIVRRCGKDLTNLSNDMYNPIFELSEFAQAEFVSITIT